MKNNVNIKIIYSLSVVLFSMMGLIINFVTSESFFNVISYFTIQSNIIVAIFFSLNAYYLHKGLVSEKHEIFRGATTLYILVTGLVFHLLLSNTYEQVGIHAFSNLIVHYFTPIATVIYTVVFSDNSKFEYTYLLQWLIYPLMYIIYTLIRGAFTGFYPYFFLDPIKIGYAAVLATIVSLAVIFSIITIIFIYLCKKANTYKRVAK